MASDLAVSHSPVALKILSDFVRALEAASDWKVLPVRKYAVEFTGMNGRHRLDVLLKVTTPRGSMDLATEIVRQGYPRDIKNALWLLDEYQRASRKGSILKVVIGAFLSPSARDALRSQEVAFFDASSKSLYLNHADLTLDIEHPGQAATRSQSAPLFSGAREQVVLALLNSGGRGVTGQELVERSQTSGFTVSQTLSELEKMGWVKYQGAGRSSLRRLTEPGQLLDAWAQAWKARDGETSGWYLSDQESPRAVESVSKKLESHGPIECALTGAAAANELAPLFPAIETLDINVPPGTAVRFAQAIGAKPVLSGANLFVHERKGVVDLLRAGVRRQPLETVNPWIVYLDLIRHNRVNEQGLAVHLRRKVLKA